MTVIIQHDGACLCVIYIRKMRNSSRVLVIIMAQELDKYDSSSLNGFKTVGYSQVCKAPDLEKQIFASVDLTIFYYIIWRNYIM